MVCKVETHASCASLAPISDELVIKVIDVRFSSRAEDGANKNKSLASTFIIKYADDGNGAFVLNWNTL